MITRKRRDIKPGTRIKKNIRKTIKKNQSAGSFFGTSYDSKITGYLMKSNVINKDQSKIILSYAKNGANKKNKIELFVDKTLEIILENLHNIWLKTPNEIKSNQNFKDLNGLLVDNRQQIPKNIIYDRLQKIHRMYGGLTETNKQILNEALSKIKLDSNITGEKLLTMLYTLYEKWVKTETLKTLIEPKFADLYEKWFDIPHKDWIERNPMTAWFLFS